MAVRLSLLNLENGVGVGICEAEKLARVNLEQLGLKRMKRK